MKKLDKRMGKQQEEINAKQADNKTLEASKIKN